MHRPPQAEIDSLKEALKILGNQGSIESPSAFLYHSTPTCIL